MEQNPHRRAKIRLQEGELILEYTKNYHLNQGEPTDRVLREDFNEDNRKIEEALNGKNGIVLGTYIGDGANGHTIDLGFTPVAVYICTRGGIAGTASGSYYCYGGLAFPDYPVILSNKIAAEIVDGGFKVYKHSDYFRINNTNEVYYYIAFQ